MSSRIAGHLRSNIVGYVAIFIALGGSAYAVTALDRNSVKSKHIKNGQVKGKDTRKSQVQARVDETCAPGRSIRAIAENGTVTCEPVGGGGSPTGPAGGDLAGSSYPNPVIANGAVNSAKILDESITGADVLGIGGVDVSDNTLTGNDIDESTLGQVPSALTATQGGKGRSSGAFVISCDPESLTFVNCRTVSIFLSAPARVLVIGNADLEDEVGDVDSGRGECLIGVAGFGPIPNSAAGGIVKASGNDRDSEPIIVMGVTGVLPTGTHTVGIDCNQQTPGAVFYTGAQVTAVALSAN